MQHFKGARKNKKQIIKNKRGNSETPKTAGHGVCEKNEMMRHKLREQSASINSLQRQWKMLFETRRAFLSTSAVPLSRRSSKLVRTELVRRSRAKSHLDVALVVEGIRGAQQQQLAVLVAFGHRGRHFSRVLSRDWSVEPLFGNFVFGTMMRKWSKK